LRLNEFENFGINYLKIPEYYDKKNKKFYPSLYRSFEWVDRVKMFIEGKKYEDMKHLIYIAKISKKIPKKIREQVWEKRNGNSRSGVCFCCDCEISDWDFQCAHILARCLGGENTIENLEPTCAKCNLDMGTTNLNSYKISLKRFIN
jgi:hypothetical protein